MIQAATTTASMLPAMLGLAMPRGDVGAGGEAFSLAIAGSVSDAPPPARATPDEGDTDDGLDIDDRQDAAPDGTALPPPVADPAFAWLPPAVLTPPPVAATPNVTVASSAAPALPAMTPTSLPVAATLPRGATVPVVLDRAEGTAPDRYAETAKISAPIHELAQPWPNAAFADPRADMVAGRSPGQATLPGNTTIRPTAASSVALALDPATPPTDVTPQPVAAALLSSTSLSPLASLVRTVEAAVVAGGPLQAVEQPDVTTPAVTTLAPGPTPVTSGKITVAEMPPILAMQCPAADVPTSPVVALARGDANSFARSTAADVRPAPTPLTRSLARFEGVPAVQFAPVEQAAPIAVAPMGDAPVVSDAPVATSVPQPRERADRSISPLAVGLAPVATPAEPVAGTTASAFQVFGAMRAAVKSRDDTAADPLYVTATTTGTPVDLRHAVAATGDAQRVPLDMTDGRWPHTMIDRIEMLRDAADATDTRMRLIPDALGSIDVSVKRDGDTLHVHFVADQAATRALIQDAQPRLAAIAQERGLTLGQSTVDAGANQSQEQGWAQQRQPEPRFSPAPASATTDDSDPAATGRLA